MTSDLIIDNILLGVFDLRLLLMQVLLFFVSLFLILLVLVQRGKGGGITGALGGMGGQSAFGSRAGDAFTKITVVTAVIWITLCMITIAYFNPPPRSATPIVPAITSTDEASDASANSESGSNEEADEVVLPGEGGADSTGDAPAGALESGSETPSTETPSIETPTETPTETPAADDGLSLPDAPALPDDSGTREDGKQ